MVYMDETMASDPKMSCAPYNVHKGTSHKKTLRSAKRNEKKLDHV